MEYKCGSDCNSSRALIYTQTFNHSLLVKLTYRSRTQDSSGYTVQTSTNLITVFIQCSCNKVFITQMTSLSWQLSVTFPNLPQPIKAGNRFSGMQGCVYLVVWLHTEMVYPPKMVTHPSTNRTQQRITLLM